MKIVALYASLLAVLFVILSVRTIRIRRALKVGVGDSGNTKLLRAMRVHANFAEYVPFSLLLIYFVETAPGHPIFIHTLGMALLVGRISHAYGVSQENENLNFRIAGMMMTFMVLLSSALYLMFSCLR